MNTTLNRLLIVIAIFTSAASFQCDKESTDDFCDTTRIDFETVDDQEGKIVYLQNLGRYAVDFNLNIPNNIDTQRLGIVCDLPPELQTVGLEVTCSGMLEYFTSQENIRPALGGQELYYFKSTEIKRR